MLDENELEKLLESPDFEITDIERKLFTLPESIKAAVERKKSDYVGGRSRCEDFDKYIPMFAQARREMADGRRKIIRFSGGVLKEGNFYYESGTLLYLERIIDQGKKTIRGEAEGRTRIIYESGEESDVLLSTLRKALYADGYAVTQSTDEIDDNFIKPAVKNSGEVPDGWIYVLSSLSKDPAIRDVKNLYKIGYSTTPVMDRIRNAAYEPTYLMSDVKVEMELAVKDCNVQKLENAIHHLFGAARFHVQVIGIDGKKYQPQEWFVVPLHIIRKAIDYIFSENGKTYVYNPAIMQIVEIRNEMEGKEKIGGINQDSLFMLSMTVTRKLYDSIVSGETTVYKHMLKETRKKRFVTRESDGKTYLNRFDAIKFITGVGNERLYAIVEAGEPSYVPETHVVSYPLGNILERIENKNES